MRVSSVVTLNVLVKFGADVPPEAEGPALLHFEQELRRTGKDIRVFKDKMGDDSKLRVKMTQMERNAL